ncbi:conserved hypothetical protein [Trichinella spiralis]|uniref:hypothetical protein n=1 Tax=Trichinella spiralis TaxID=6334 RepID=UPI0001EFCD8F|nr:conserved hypothetical protein [Trichinella spiralis]
MEISVLYICLVLKRLYRIAEKFLRKQCVDQHRCEEKLVGNYRTIPIQPISDPPITKMGRIIADVDTKPSVDIAYFDVSICAPFDKKGCSGAIWTNLDVTSVMKRNDHIKSCPVDEHLAYKMEKKALLKKRRAEETKPMPAIYDEEVSAASAEPSTSGHFSLFKRPPGKAIPKTAQSSSGPANPCLVQDNVVRQWYQQLFTIHAFVAGKLVPEVYRLCTGKDIGTYGFIFQALLNKVAALGVNLNPKTIICDFETALIPVIQCYIPNTRVQGCYFHFCQAVHRKVGELGLKTRYRTEEETR